MSLRSRLLVGIGVIAAVLIGAAALVTRTTESYLIQRVDTQLASAPVRDSTGPTRGPPRDEPFTSLNSMYVGLVGADGTVMTLRAPSGAASNVALPKFSQARALAALADHKPFTTGADGSSGTRYRAQAVGNSNERFIVALPLTDVDASVARLVNLEMVATALILACLGLVAFWVLRLGVRPIKRMTATATAIAAGDLSHRVPDVEAGTEAGELGLALNAMLGRIEDAFDQRAASEQRLRRFVGDASHELRTPVTTIRGYAELYRSGGLADADELDQAMRRTEQEAIRMGRLVDDMLLLARLDQGRPLERAPVSLGQLAEDAARDASAVAPDRRVEAVIDGEVSVTGDEGRLRQVVANLVANALVHTPPGTAVHLEVRRDNGSAVIEVSDEGPGMTEDVAEHVFERFYRADPSRSRHHGGSGLGLSIVQAIVAAHGGRVAVRTAPGEGTAVRVELPASEDGRPAQPAV